MFGREPMFVHVITLALGLIIAFGLQQIVELVQRRRRQRKASAAEQLAASTLVASKQADEG
jgi:predicted PurR-regulated permease PerM